MNSCIHTGPRGAYKHKHARIVSCQIIVWGKKTKDKYVSTLNFVM
jgi:hypothetical protein